MRRHARHIIFSLGYELKNNVACRYRQPAFAQECERPLQRDLTQNKIRKECYEFVRQIGENKLLL